MSKPGDFMTKCEDDNGNFGKPGQLAVATDKGFLWMDAGTNGQCLGVDGKWRDAPSKEPTEFQEKIRDIVIEWLSSELAANMCYTCKTAFKKTRRKHKLAARDYRKEFEALLARVEEKSI